MGIPHQREWHNRSAGETAREAPRSFDLNDLPVLSHSKHEENLVGDAGAGKAATRDHVEEVAVASLQRVATDKRDVLVFGAILLGIVEALLEGLLTAALGRHCRNGTLIQSIPHELGIKRGHTLDVF